MLTQAHELLHCVALQEALTLLSESSVSLCRSPQSAGAPIELRAGGIAEESLPNAQKANLETERAVNYLSE